MSVEHLLATHGPAALCRSADWLHWQLTSSNAQLVFRLLPAALETQSYWNHQSATAHPKMGTIYRAGRHHSYGRHTGVIRLSEETARQDECREDL